MLIGRAPFQHACVSEEHELRVMVIATSFNRIVIEIGASYVC